MNQHLANERKETDALKAEALRLGIQIPRDPGWWWIDEEVALEMSSVTWELLKGDHEYLTEIGTAGTRKLIRDELRRLEVEARKDIEWQRQATQWKLTVAGVIIGWILGISGIVIAVISLLRKAATH